MKVRPGTALHFGGRGVSYGPGDELVVTEDEAAQLLREKGRRSFEIVEVLDDEALGSERSGPGSAS
ncbi:MAG: hypothetical protein ABI649_05115 [Gaiellaceae bacterium]